MEPLAIAFVVFFFLTIVLGPIFGAESRPEFFVRTASPGRWSLRCGVRSALQRGEIGVEVRQRGGVD